MQGLLQAFGHEMPGRVRLFDWLLQAVVQLSAYGICNFLLSQGESLFAHCSTRLSYLVRQALFVAVHPAIASVVIATAPLTDNAPWQIMPSGRLWCFGEGSAFAEAAIVAKKAPIMRPSAVNLPVFVPVCRYGE